MRAPCPGRSHVPVRDVITKFHIFRGKGRGLGYSTGDGSKVEQYRFPVANFHGKSDSSPRDPALAKRGKQVRVFRHPLQDSIRMRTAGRLKEDSDVVHSRTVPMIVGPQDCLPDPDPQPEVPP